MGLMSTRPFEVRSTTIKAARSNQPRGGVLYKLKSRAPRGVTSKNYSLGFFLSLGGKRNLQVKLPQDMFISQFCHMFEIVANGSQAPCNERVPGEL